MATIFIVDDQKDLIELMSEEFESYGFDVCAYDDQEKFFSALSIVNCHLIISDFSMPGINGLELFLKVKEKMAEKCPPYIFFTGSKISYNALLEVGATAVFKKPAEFQEMSDFVQNIFERQR